jgi:hypothetical protein
MTHEQKFFVGILCIYIFVKMYSKTDDFETTETFKLSITLEIDGFAGLEETKGDLTMIEYPDYSHYYIKFPYEEFSLGGVFSRLLGYDFRNDNFLVCFYFAH